MHHQTNFPLAKSWKNYACVPHTSLHLLVSLLRSPLDESFAMCLASPLKDVLTGGMHYQASPTQLAEVLEAVPMAEALDGATYEADADSDAPRATCGDAEDIGNSQRAREQVRDDGALS